jgi:drug/metabolite transporter (DMT)-like permease
LRNHRTLGFLACALASSFWGCGFFFGKIALAEMNVGAMVLYRFLFAALALIPLLFTHRPRFTSHRLGLSDKRFGPFDKKEWRTLLLCAFLGIPLQFLIQFSGLARTTVSHASLMVGTMPVLLAVAATLFAHERMDITGWLALAVSTLGAALIALAAHGAPGAPSIPPRGIGGMDAHTSLVSGSHIIAQLSTPTLTGDLLVVLSLVIALGWVLLNKRLLRTHSAITVSTWGVVTGTAMLLVSVPLLYGLPPVAHVSRHAWLALAASGILCTAATTLLWNWGLTQVPASQAGVLLNMEPLIGSILGIFLLHDSLGPSARLGGALILLAALVITTRSRTRVREQLPST